MAGVPKWGGVDSAQFARSATRGAALPNRRRSMSESSHVSGQMGGTLNVRTPPIGPSGRQDLKPATP